MFRRHRPRMDYYNPRTPENIAKDNQQISEWAAWEAERRRAEQPIHAKSTPIRTLKAKAREAFMRHPAATEYDFEVCWPEIRRRLLTRQALIELERELADEVEELPEPKRILRLASGDD